MTTFDELVVSRRVWIDEILKPWCREACLQDLKKAEVEWNDIAGDVDPQRTLWTWAWSRFPELVHEGLNGIDETSEVRITLKDGRSFSGYSDGRRSQDGKLVVLCTSHCDKAGDTGFSDPHPIDDIASVARVTDR